MKVLLDESVDVHFRDHLPGHSVFTVTYMRWKGLKNGALISHADKDSFEVLITTDQSISKQQNRATLPIGIIVMVAASNDIADLQPLVPKVLLALNRIQKGQVIVVGP
jgi:hypothetical protein